MDWWMVDLWIPHLTVTVHSRCSEQPQKGAKGTNMIWPIAKPLQTLFAPFAPFCGHNGLLCERLRLTGAMLIIVQTSDLARRTFFPDQINALKAPGGTLDFELLIWTLD